MAEKRDEWKITVGDYVVYPTHGVGQISEITTDKVAGFDIEFLVISFAKNRMTLKIPVDKIEISGLRKLSTEYEIKKAVEIMRTPPQAKRMVWAKRSQEYEEKINSGEPSEIAEVVRDLYKRADRPEQSFSERQIYEQAVSRLADEYGAIFGLPGDDAVAKIEGVLEREDKKRQAEAETGSAGQDAD
ncbi:MAG: CarD family transcriptional regulator [Rickettsiales bacterium]|jgi:CarD family transcriptional regulator|nr:CarD family transcriptional regulator [Rickettsiales bacterium]